jgi:GNAT superfamily N-acetyltransferase
VDRPFSLYHHKVRLTLRQWHPGDELFLWEMLYQSIHVADGEPPPPRSILDDPSIAHYLNDFGGQDGDDAVIAYDSLTPVGAAFCRRFTSHDPSYGFVSADVPEFGMAVVAHQRGKGVGRALLMHLLDRYPIMSLSVDYDNVSARHLYQSLGFADFRVDGTSVTTIKRQ